MKTKAKKIKADTKTIRASRIELVDGKGRVRIVLSGDEELGPGLVLLDVLAHLWHELIPAPVHFNGFCGDIIGGVVGKQAIAIEIGDHDLVSGGDERFAESQALADRPKQRVRAAGEREDNVACIHQLDENAFGQKTRQQDIGRRREGRAGLGGVAGDEEPGVGEEGGCIEDLAPAIVGGEPVHH